MSDDLEGPGGEVFDGFASFDEWWAYQEDCAAYERERHEALEHWAASDLAR